MTSGTLTEALVRTLDRAATALGRDRKRPQHLVRGTRGEEAAYFYLRKFGYVMVARNYRSSRRKGEVDLIGFDGDTLCFIEVKTLSKRGFVPAEAQVDAAKQRELRYMARDYLNHRRDEQAYRFDVISVYLPDDAPPEFHLIKNAFPIR